MYGVSDAMTDNFTLGITGAVGADNKLKVGDASDYNVGRTLGDVVSILGGVVEIGTGAGGTVLSGGTLSVAGVAAISHGVGVIGKAALGTGRMEARKNKNGDSSTSSSSDSQKGGKKPTDSKKNDKHGDGGRSLEKAEQQIQDLQSQREGSTVTERKKIDNKIRNIRETAEKNRKGTEDSNANKR